MQWKPLTPCAWGSAHGAMSHQEPQTVSYCAHNGARALEVTPTTRMATALRCSIHTSRVAAASQINARSVHEITTMKCQPRRHDEPRHRLPLLKALGPPASPPRKDDQYGTFGYPRLRPPPWKTKFTINAACTANAGAMWRTTCFKCLQGDSNNGPLLAVC